MGEYQESQKVQAMPASSPSAAIIDVVENMRAKIYSLFYKIGYTELPGMTTEDYVTLTIIEQYLNLKVCATKQFIKTAANTTIPKVMRCSKFWQNLEDSCSCYCW